MASLKFEDNTSLDASDWAEIVDIVKTRAREKKAKPVEIKQGSVTVKVKGLDPKAKEDHINYIEARHKDWKIRVWPINSKSVYACNYFKGENVQYLEVNFDSVRDENGVFSYVTSIIDDM